MKQSRQEFHTSIRKDGNDLKHISFRNKLQMKITLAYVQSLKIPSTPPSITLQTIINELTEQVDDLDMDCLHKPLIQIIKYCLQGKQSIQGLLNTLIPSQLNSIAELIPQMRLKDEKTQNRDKNVHLLKYIFIFIHEVAKSLKNSAGLQMQRLMNTQDIFNQQENNNVNKILLYFSTAVLQYDYAEQITKGVCLASIFCLMKRYSSRKAFQLIQSSAATFVRNYLYMYPKLKNKYPLPNEILVYINQITMTIINNSSYYMEQFQYRPIKRRVYLIVCALYIFNALLPPLVHFNNIPFDKFVPIIQNRYRHYNAFKYILKICLKAIKYSDQCSLMILNNQKFLEILKPSLRVNQNQIIELLTLLLDYQNAHTILKGEVVILILDLPQSCHKTKQKIFQIMFKYFQILNYSTKEAESRIILRKVSKNQQPFSDFRRQAIFWRNLILNGYQTFVPLYMKQQLDDILTAQQRERIRARQNGQILDRN